MNVIINQVKDNKVLFEFRILSQKLRVVSEAVLTPTANMKLRREIPQIRHISDINKGLVLANIVKCEKILVAVNKTIKEMAERGEL